MSHVEKSVEASCRKLDDGQPLDSSVCCNCGSRQNIKPFEADVCSSRENPNPKPVVIAYLCATCLESLMANMVKCE